MTGRLNKKVLCFIDEYGTAGKSDLYFGIAIAKATDVSKIDKVFSDTLNKSAGEIHSVNLSDDYLKSLLLKLRQDVVSERLVLVNYKTSSHIGPPETLYAKGVIESVKVSIKIFRDTILKKRAINNVDLILDINNHNAHESFDKEINIAKENEGLFKAVNNVSKIDSAASRLLQIADMTAYSRKFILNENINAQQLRVHYGIQIR